MVSFAVVLLIDVRSNPFLGYRIKFWERSRLSYFSRLRLRLLSRMGFLVGNFQSGDSMAMLLNLSHVCGLWVVVAGENSTRVIDVVNFMRFGTYGQNLLDGKTQRKWLSTETRIKGIRRCQPVRFRPCWLMNSVKKLIGIIVVINGIGFFLDWEKMAINYGSEDEKNPFSDGILKNLDYNITRQLFEGSPESEIVKTQAGTSDLVMGNSFKGLERVELLILVKGWDCSGFFKHKRDAGFMSEILSMDIATFGTVNEFCGMASLMSFDNRWEKFRLSSPSLNLVMGFQNCGTQRLLRCNLRKDGRLMSDVTEGVCHSKGKSVQVKTFTEVKRHTEGLLTTNDDETNIGAGMLRTTLSLCYSAKWLLINSSAKDPCDRANGNGKNSGVGIKRLMGTGPPADCVLEGIARMKKRMLRILGCEPGGYTYFTMS